MSIIRTPAAFSVSGDVLDYSLHDNDRPSFFARVEKVRLREITLVLAPVDRRARVLRRELPSPMSAFGRHPTSQSSLKA
jgi:hypothetical protein